MAMETKILEVKNSEETSVIQYWARFGWNLKSSQRIYSKDSHLERRGEDVVSVTETIDFTKIILERDMSNPNYKTISMLEKEYFSLEEVAPATAPVDTKLSKENWAKSYKPDYRSKFEKISFFFLLIGGIFLLAYFEQFDTALTMTLQVIGALAIVASFITNSMFKKAKIKKALENIDAQLTKRLNDDYNSYCNQFENSRQKALKNAERYEYAQKRMPEILAELQDLI